MAAKKITIVIRKGEVHFIYSPEAMALMRHMGAPEIRRASHVEPDPVTGEWAADLGPVAGPRLGPFPPEARDEALAAEAAWLLEHRILGRPQACHDRPESSGSG